MANEIGLNCGVGNLNAKALFENENTRKNEKEIAPWSLGNSNPQN
jgi:hypothetical protein